MKIVIRSIETPTTKKPDAIIKWFCEALGIAAGNDDSDVEERIFRALAYAALNNEGVSSTDLTAGGKLARSTIIYHLNRLMDMGLITRRGRKYRLRATNLSKMVKELEYDLDREMSRMLDVAQEFDRLMLQHQAKEGHVKPKMLKKR